ncbi:MAG: MFS transporter [Reinekea sp.]|nr:MFS transporter [Reinekea sp.]
MTTASHLPTDDTVSNLNSLSKPGSTDSDALPALPAERRIWVTSAVMLVLFLAAMDATVMGTLMPVLKAEFAQPELYPWLISGFLFSSVLSIPLMGLLADRVGEKRTMLAALLAFMGSSLLVAAATTMQALIAARVLQGVGAGGIIVLAYVMVGKLYSNAERGKMQGVLSAMWGLAAVSGPMLGALFHAYFSWRWAFLLNLPLGAIFLVLLALLYPQAGVSPHTQRFDALGFVTFAVGTLSALLLVMASALQLNSRWFVGLTVVMVGSYGALGFSMRRKTLTSFLAYEFFSSRLSVAGVATVLASLVVYAAMTLLPLYLVDVVGRSVLAAGLTVVMASLGWTVGATVCGLKAGNWGVRVCCVTGFGLLATGAFVLSLTSTSSALAWHMLAQFCIGLGIGFVATASLLQAQNSAGHARMGVMTSAIQLFRNLGAALGVNTLAALQFWLVTGLGVSVQSSFSVSFAVLLVIAFSGIGLSLFMRHSASK